MKELNQKFIPQFKKARNLYFIALAMNETNINIDTQSKQEVLNENVFYIWDYDRSGKEIYKQLKTPFSDFHLKEDDFKRYCILSHEKRVKKGLVLPYNKYDFAINEPWNLSADCETRPLLRNAENNLIQAGINLLPEPLYSQFKKLDILKNYTHKEKVIKIMLQLKLNDDDNLTTKEILSEVL